MASASLSNALFVLHALCILAKTPLEKRFRSFYSPDRGASAKDSEIIERKGANAVLHTRALCC
jgi:hypothetical protein